MVTEEQPGSQDSFRVQVGIWQVCCLVSMAQNLEQSGHQITMDRKRP